MWKKKIFNHDSTVNFFLFYAANFCFLGAYYLLFPIIPNYVHSLQAGLLGVMPVNAAYFLAIILAAPLIGYFADWQGRLRFALAGAALSALLIFAYPFLTKMSQLLLVRFLHGIATAAFTVSLLTILTDSTEHVWRGEILSSFLISQIFWTALGPSFALFLTSLGGTKTVFITATILTIISFIFTLLIRRPRLFALQRREINVKELLLLENLMVLAALFVFNAVTSAVLLNVDAFLAKTQGDMVIGFYAWFVLSGILVMYNAGNLSDRLGRGKTAFLGFAFVAISLMILLIVTKKNTLAFAGIFLGVAYAIMLPTLPAWWMDIIPLNKRGFLNGVFVSIQSAGLIIGVMVLNIFGYLGLKWIFAAGLVLTLTEIGALAYTQWTRTKK